MLKTRKANIQTVLAALILGVFGILAPPAFPQDIQVSGDLTPASLPDRMTLPVEISNLPTLRQRVEAAGNLTLRNAVYRTGLPNPDMSIDYTLVAKNLKLDSSRIVTNGNSLKIFCESISMDETSKLLTFEGDTLRPVKPGPNSYHGVDGAPGDSGGNIRIYILSEIRGTLRLELTGQNGGEGGDGQQGATGKRGDRGRNARNGPLGTCERGQGKGHTGNPGAKGGNAGNGGMAGNGGVANVIFVNRDLPTNPAIDFSGNPGHPGEPGKRGEGGAGGPGGPPGRCAGNCDCRGSGRGYGKTGDAGAQGDAAVPGNIGREGNMKIEQLSLP